jgi:hypothetical protein
LGFSLHIEGHDAPRANHQHLEKMNYTNPYTNKPETKEERIARYADAEKTYRIRAQNLPGGFKGKLTRMANEMAARIIELKAA